MIRLMQIKKSNNVITCQARLEDSRDAMSLTYHISTRDFDAFLLPEGFEWCRTHIAMARRFFEQLGNADPPKEKVIMWN